MTLSELPQGPKERVNQLRNEWQTWTDQAVYALIQGQAENEFIAHCRPDNRPAALKAWRHAERLGAKVIGAYRHMEACRALLKVPSDEMLYAGIEKLRDSHKELWSALHELDMAHSHQTLCRAKERARAAMAHAASVCGKRDDLQEELV